MLRLVCVLIVLFGAACTKKSQPAARTPATQAAERNRAEASPPPEIAELAEAVEQVRLGATEATHGRLVSALRKLAVVTRMTDPAAAAEIEEHAARLVQSSPTERTHADIVKHALTIALDAFGDQLPDEPDPTLRAAYVSARRGVLQLRGEVALRRQSTEVAAAMRSLTNTAAILRGLPPIFAAVERDVEVGYDAGKLDERAPVVSQRVAEVAKERGWQPAGQKAARALHAIADALEVAPLALRTQQWSTLVIAVRYEAVELERESAISLDRSDRLKAALLACVDALDQLQAGARSRAVASLVRSARAAVTAIDEHTTFVFQRAIIQEALRLSADAFVVLALQPPQPVLQTRR